MALTNAGRDFIANAIINNGSPDFFIEADTWIGVGNSATAVSPTDTDLLGASKLRVVMDAGFPTIATNVLTFQSTFATGVGNFTWAEWGVFNDTAAGTMLARKVEALGTKTSAQTWQITVELTVAIGT